MGNSTTKRHQLIEIDQYTDDMPEITESGEEKTFRDVVWMFSV